MLTINNMLLKIGNTGFANWTRVLPYFVFEFSDPDKVPGSSLYSTEKGYSGIWTQVSSSPNRWKLEIERFVEVYDGQTSLGMGLARLFCPSDRNPCLVPARLGGGTCKIIESGNLDIVDANGNTCQSMDRMLLDCTGLTGFSTMQCSNVVNVGGMFQGCTEVTAGAYGQYMWFLNNGVNITNHSSTFSNCGSNTVTGAAELAQIPVGWGGTQVPVSTLMTSTLVNIGSYPTMWIINTNNPTWTNVKNGLYLFTETSVSQYAGVSMNRSRINGKHNGLGTAQATYALYFYPAFIQLTDGMLSRNLTWLVTTNTPNGSLAQGQANIDMSGTLDYGTYGTFAREYGTYDSSKDVYFLFLVTNVPIDQWNGFTDAYGFLYNSNFKTDAALRWFFE